jgi:hypothetical protein
MERDYLEDLSVDRSLVLQDILNNQLGGTGLGST